MEEKRSSALADVLGTVLGYGQWRGGHETWGTIAFRLSSKTSAWVLDPGIAMLLKPFLLHRRDVALQNPSGRDHPVPMRPPHSMMLLGKNRPDRIPKEILT